jgi:FKBP-type peptidyl-prolyl cis-trans isomerase SlyD
MEIQHQSRVKLSYRLTLDNQEGELVEETSQNEPFECTIGDGNQLPSFEENLKGLKAGDAFSFIIKERDAYGSYEDESIAILPKSVFAVEDKIDESLFKLHRILPMKDEEGNTYNGIIVAITENDVTLDFNHPLAGEDLCFSGQIIDVG